MIVFRGLRVGGVAPAMSGHPPSAAAAPLLRRTGRQAAVTPSGGREKRPFLRALALSLRGPCDAPPSRRTTLRA